MRHSDEWPGMAAARIWPALGLVMRMTVLSGPFESLRLAYEASRLALT